MRFTGLWQHADFMRLWAGQTISVFGSMIGGTAMTFTAILFLNATPFQMGVLSAMEMAPALLAGLFAGAWVDRVRRRPLMILADVGRASALATIPAAAVAGILNVEQLYLVALAASVLSILFNLAYQSHLPGLVGKTNLVEGNSKLTASAAVAEFGGFSIGGWLVQILTAPVAILLDALSFLVSAFAVSRIRAPEILSESVQRPNLRREIGEGLKEVWQAPLLRAGALVVIIQNLTGTMYGTLVVLFMSRGLGFSPGVLGMIWAVGGFNRRVLLGCNLRSLDHFVALRAAPNAHFSMRRLAFRMAEQAQAATPLLGSYLRVPQGETWQSVEEQYFTQV